jgi:uncharacterized protein DUF3224
MPTHATAEFKVTNWDENPTLTDDGGPKITHASVTMDFHGDLEGKGSVEWLMGYDDAGKTAKFVGLERVVGKIGDRSGSFVLQHSGTFDGKIAKAKVDVVPGSGTGDLEGMRGKGSFEAGLGEDGVRNIDLDYDL